MGCDNVELNGVDQDCPSASKHWAVTNGSYQVVDMGCDEEARLSPEIETVERPTLKPRTFGTLLNGFFSNGNKWIMYLFALAASLILLSAFGISTLNKQEPVGDIPTPKETLPTLPMLYPSSPRLNSFLKDTKSAHIIFNPMKNTYGWRTMTVNEPLNVRRLTWGSRFKVKEEDFHWSLSTFANVEVLEIKLSWGFCSGFVRDSTTKNFTTSSLKKLGKLIFTGVPDCPEVFEKVRASLLAPNLHTIQLQGGFLSAVNCDTIYNLVKDNESSLKTFILAGTQIGQCELIERLQSEAKWLTVQIID